MFQLGNTLVSEELLEAHFACDLSQCKGACCVEGEAGAPLDESEVDRLARDYESIAPFWDPAGRDAIAAQGTSIVAKDKSLETPLVDGKACAYATFDERGWAHCGIEQAHQAGAVDLEKTDLLSLVPRARKRLCCVYGGQLSPLANLQLGLCQWCAKANAFVSLCGRGLATKIWFGLVCGVGACGKRTK